MRKILFVYTLKVSIFKMHEKYTKELIKFEELLSNDKSIKAWEYNEDAYNIRVVQEVVGKDLFSDQLSQAIDLYDSLSTPIFIKSVRVAIDGLFEERSYGMRKLSFQHTKEFVRLLEGFRENSTIYMTSQIMAKYVGLLMSRIDNYRKTILLYSFLKHSTKSFVPMLSNYLVDTPEECGGLNSLKLYFERNNGFDLIAKWLRKKNKANLTGNKPTVLLNAK